MSGVSGGYWRRALTTPQREASGPVLEGRLVASVLGANPVLSLHWILEIALAYENRPSLRSPPALFVQWPGLSEKGALDIEQNNLLFKDRKAGSQTQSLNV